ncbi:MAG: hypothetical protein VSS75_016240 [Candidatus Parabeggiatoa sp.]|nr:hypothetical protein [Candidatus Parabeggiatoa sp.]
MTKTSLLAIFAAFSLALAGPIVSAEDAVEIAPAAEVAEVAVEVVEEVVVEEVAIEEVADEEVADEEEAEEAE